MSAPRATAESGQNLHSPGAGSRGVFEGGVYKGSEAPSMPVTTCLLVGVCVGGPHCPVGPEVTAAAAAAADLSLVEAMTGPDQVRMLADQLQAGAMLRYNKRMVG